MATWPPRHFVWKGCGGKGHLELRPDAISLASPASLPSPPSDPASVTPPCTREGSARVNLAPGACADRATAPCSLLKAERFTGWSKREAGRVGEPGPQSHCQETQRGGSRPSEAAWDTARCRPLGVAGQAVAFAWSSTWPHRIQTPAGSHSAWHKPGAGEQPLCLRCNSEPGAEVPSRTSLPTPADCPFHPRCESSTFHLPPQSVIYEARDAHGQSVIGCAALL